MSRPRRPTGVSKAVKESPADSTSASPAGWWTLRCRPSTPSPVTQTAALNQHCRPCTTATSVYPRHTVTGPAARATAAISSQPSSTAVGCRRCAGRRGRTGTRPASRGAAPAVDPVRRAAETTASAFSTPRRTSRPKCAAAAATRMERESSGVVVIAVILPDGTAGTPAAAPDLAGLVAQRSSTNVHATGLAGGPTARRTSRPARPERPRPRSAVQSTTACTPGTGPATATPTARAGAPPARSRRRRERCGSADGDEVCEAVTDEEVPVGVEPSAVAQGVPPVADRLSVRRRSCRWGGHGA